VRIVSEVPQFGAMHYKRENGKKEGKKKRQWLKIKRLRSVKKKEDPVHNLNREMFTLKHGRWYQRPSASIFSLT
jgi:hypothetical protein